MSPGSDKFASSKVFVCMWYLLQCLSKLQTASKLAEHHLSAIRAQDNTFWIIYAARVIPLWMLQNVKLKAIIVADGEPRINHKIIVPLWVVCDWTNPVGLQLHPDNIFPTGANKHYSTLLWPSDIARKKKKPCFHRKFMWIKYLPILEARRVKEKKNPRPLTQWSISIDALFGVKN